ncbi:unnamed protein product [Caenorhabditis angaria]|uniref:Uncharacterized protein n=1 Tax=Caenorhabditis angaria TaxID=860376 RepID=A0A9P1N3L9_9PELO|nr:unnamed protein product [Caenorhabditis angaria]
MVLYYLLIVISIRLIYFLIFYEFRKKEKEAIVFPLYSSIFLVLLGQVFMIHTIPYFMTGFVTKYESEIEFFVLAFESSHIILNLFLLMIALQRIVIMLNIQFLSKYVQGKPLQYTITMIHLIFISGMINYKYDRCADGFCKAYHIIIGNETCGAEVGADVEAKVQASTSMFEYDSRPFTEKVGSYLNLINQITIGDYILLGIHQIIPLISLFLHLILLVSIKLNKNVMSETRKIAELAIIYQNIPIFMASTLQTSLIAFAHFNLPVFSTYNLQFLLCNLRPECDFVIPLSYIFGYHKHIRKVFHSTNPSELEPSDMVTTKNPPQNNSS